MTILIEVVDGFCVFRAEESGKAYLGYVEEWRWEEFLSRRLGC